MQIRHVLQPLSDGAKIELRVLLPLALILMAAVLAFPTAAYVLHAKAQRAALDRTSHSVQELFRLAVDKDAGMMHATIDAMTADPNLTAAMERGDKAALEQTLQPLFAHLRDEHAVDHLYVTLPDRNSLLKMDGPGRSGQVVDRLDMFDTAENGAQSYGLDLGQLGTLTLRVVVPWRDAHGKLLGFIELGEKVRPMIEAMHRVLDVDLLVLVRKDLLSRDKWEEGERLIGRQDSWDQMTSSVAVVQTLQSIPMALSLLLEDGSRPSKAVIGMEDGRRVFSLGTQPLLDVSQQPIGEIVILRDVTAGDKEMDRCMALLVVGFALAGAIAFFVGHAMLARAQRGE